MSQWSKITHPTLLEILLMNDVSIIAVTGLAGHGYGSWKERGGDFMWLRDALPSDMPNARVMTFGYISRLQGSSSFAGINDYAKFLLAEVKAARKDPLVCVR